MDWIDDPVVTIPANGREHYFIHSSFWLSQEQLDSLENGGTSLRVVGFFEYQGTTNFCYKYLGLQGEYRLPKIPQFVPCDFTPRLATTIGMSGVQAKGEIGTVGVVIKEIPPEDAARPQKEEQANGEDEAK